MESIVRNQLTAVQVRALEGAANNPLNDKKWPENRGEILEERRRLPVYQKYQEILDAYNGAQVIVLSSETGSGKSTQVPQLLTWAECNSGGRVVCTQPRVSAAKELAARVAKEMAVRLGDEVGYVVRGDNKTKGKTTRLAYVTDGVVLQQFATDPTLRSYSCVVVDEAHQRTIDIDLILALLKRAIAMRKDLKVVVMSAKLNADGLSQYFNGSPVVFIPGRDYKVSIKYTPNPGPDFVVLAAAAAIHIHQTKPEGAILIFLPGKGEIRSVCDLLIKYSDLDVFSLYAGMPAEDQRRAIGPSGQNRKCIVSTNVAETSLTIPDIVYVIDSGLSRQMRFNPRLDLHMLELRTISQASAMQRASRAGLTRDGACYRLYSKKAYGDMPAATKPGILTDPVHSAILTLRRAGYRYITDFDWLTAPAPEAMMRAAQDLLDWGLLDESGTPTPSGMQASRFPIGPMWYRAIDVASKIGPKGDTKLNCVTDMLEIAVLCSLQRPIFLRPWGYTQVAGLLHTAFAHPLSDHLTLVNAFNAYFHVRTIHKARKAARDKPAAERSEQEALDAAKPDFSLEGWCHVHALSSPALEDAITMRRQLNRSLAAADISGSRAEITDLTTVRKALALAFPNRVAIHHAGSAYRAVPENTGGLVLPASPLFGRTSEWIIQTHFQTTGRRQYFGPATAINAEWLVDLPRFQDDQLPKKWDGKLRQPQVKESLDRARSRRRSLVAIDEDELMISTMPSSTPSASDSVVSHFKKVEKLGVGGRDYKVIGDHDYKIWPKEWKDQGEKDEDEIGANLRAALADVQEQERYWDVIGVPCHRVVADPDGVPRMQSRNWVSYYAADSAMHDDNIDIEYVAMHRDAPGGELTPATDYKKHNQVVQGEDFVIVPVSEVPRLEKEGWKLWYAPEPAFEPTKGYKDVRDVEKPQDVMSTGNPVVDSARFLERGSTFVSSVMTKTGFSYGQLIGKDGSNPEIIAQSPSTADFTPQDGQNERRPVSSTGHMTQNQRPDAVCPGWGVHDRFTEWEEFGRRVTQEMVEQADWITDRLAPIAFKDEDDEDDNDEETAEIPFDRGDLPRRPVQPQTLAEVLSAASNKSKKYKPAPATGGTQYSKV